jgi:hypothetical protein
MDTRLVVIVLLAQCRACKGVPETGEDVAIIDSDDVDDSAAGSASGDAAPLERALWVWDVPFGDATAEVELVETAVAGGFNTLYLSDYVPKASHHRLLERAHMAGLTVVALAGDPNWVERPGRAALHVEAVNAFNHGGERYDAIQHDTEFYLLAGWSTSRATVLSKYLDETGKAAAASEVPYTVALPFWLAADEYRSIAARVDGVALMAYRDSAAAVIDVAKDEVAGPVGCVVGVELNPSREPEYVTFYEEGPEAMLDALDQVEERFAGEVNFRGVAVHDAAAWKASL